MKYEAVKFLKEKVEEIHEGIQNLKKLDNFNSLKNSERTEEVEKLIDGYRQKSNIEALKHAWNIFIETSIAAAEGSMAYDETIWNANIIARGKSTTLEYLFNDLQELLEKYYK